MKAEIDSFVEVVEMEEKGLVMEVFSELKTIIKFQFVLIVILISAIIGQHFYHIYQWSQFDNVIVDSTDGGNANYIGNDGDIANYGEGGSAQKEEEQQEKIKRN